MTFSDPSRWAFAAALFTFAVAACDDPTIPVLTSTNPHDASGSVSASSSSSGSGGATCADEASCDDGDACTTGDICARGECKGVPMACTQELPTPTCVSATKLRTYADAGTCFDGVCGSFKDTECASGCADGKCNTVPAILDAASNTICAVVGGDALKCWGGGTMGTLGDNSQNDSHVPVGVVGLSSGVMDVAMGSDHGCALVFPGQVQCWGSNGSGQLGSDTPLDSLVPVVIPSLASGVVSISSGTSHTCVLMETGGVKCWGDNSNWQLGNGSKVASSAVPVDVTGLSSGVAAIPSGLGHVCALTSSGGIKCWGDNVLGQLGELTPVSLSAVPVDVTGITAGALAVSAGSSHTCALLPGAAVRCWGRNMDGELGNDSFALSVVPVDVTGLPPGVVAVAAGGADSCVLTSAGAVQCWGDNAWGQLGNGTLDDSAVPVPVSGLSSGVVEISVGGRTNCAVLATGETKCWGYNGMGALGNGSTTDSPVPVDVVGL